MAHRMEEMAAKARGKLESAKVALEGLTGVFRKLSEEHGQVSALLMRLQLSSDHDLRRELFPIIRKELLSHEQGELRELYPEFRRHPETRAIADAHEREASALRELIDELAATPVDEPAWTHTFEALIDQVKQHVREEEREYFPIGQKTFGNKTKLLLERYERTKAEVMQELETIH